MRRAMHAGMMLRRAMTVGVRGVLEDRDGRVLLVRHTYVKGWHFPGGGVEPGETAAEALAREVAEEAAVRLTLPPVLVSNHLNRRLNNRDHVLLFRCPGWEAAGEFRAGMEIAEARFFALGEMPGDLSRGTARRIGELYRGEPPSADW